MVLQACNKYGRQMMTVISIISANFTGCDLILEISWLQTTKLTIKWEELAAVCEAKNLDAFMVDWKDLKNVINEK